MRLNIGIITAKQLFGPVSCQILYHVHTLTAAVVPAPRIPFRIFVSQDASHSGHHSLAHPVLRSDQLNVGILPFSLCLDRPCNLRIYLQDLIKRIHMYPSCLFDKFTISVTQNLCTYFTTEYGKTPLGTGDFQKSPVPNDQSAYRIRSIRLIRRKLLATA